MRCCLAQRDSSSRAPFTQLNAHRRLSGSRTDASGGRFVIPVNFGRQDGSQSSYNIAAQAGPVLYINVGDKGYHATASTLRKSPLLNHMLDCANATTAAVAAASDIPADGSAGTAPLFLDRSGEFFQYILDFLRSGHWLLGERGNDAEFVDALRDEAAFYGLESGPMPRVAEYVTVWQFRDDTSWYVDCLDHTIKEDPDYQGLFRLCKYSGGLPLDDQTRTKRFRATTHNAQSVIAYFAMRGFILSQVVEGSMISHTTSSDGQNRSGAGVQYILSRFTSN